MPRISVETRRRIVAIKSSGYSVTQIQQRLADEDIRVSKVTIYKLLKKYEECRTVLDKPRRASLPRKLNADHVKFIDDSMAANDEITARQMRILLLEKWPSLQISLNTIKRTRKHLGWVATRPKYCQLVREVNKIKRLNWCKESEEKGDQFDNVIWTDECSVQLDSHGRLCFRKKLQPRRFKPKPKHPVKVHIWGGISKRGATAVLIFKGTLTAVRYCIILEQALKPFVDKVFPTKDYRFQQDNDPKHTSNYAKKYFIENGIKWWHTPPESPDLNPIENVWGSLKYYLRHEYKPTNLASLEDGIKKFWKTLTPQLCRKYISHLHTVIPKVIAANGAASGY